MPKHAESIACAAETLYLERKLSVRQIVPQLHISKSTLYAYLRYSKVQIGKYALQIAAKEEGDALHLLLMTDVYLK